MSEAIGFALIGIASMLTLVWVSIAALLEQRRRTYQDAAMADLNRRLTRI